MIDPLWESRSTKVLVQAVEDGFGISVLPYCLIEEYLKATYVYNERSGKKVDRILEYERTH